MREFLLITKTLSTRVEHKRERLPLYGHIISDEVISKVLGRPLKGGKRQLRRSF